MEKNKNIKTKELNLEKDITKKTKDVKEEKTKKDVKEAKTKTSKNKKEDKPSNSFYEETSTVASDSKWYKDWRGKALILILAGSLLIAAGIPSGMAIAGYWKKFHGDEIPYAPSIYEKIIDEIKVATNSGYIEQLDNMTEQGWFTDSQHKLIVKNANDDADDQIKSEKKSIKDEYGKVWEDAWNKKLQKDGFSNDKQYKDSIIADKYKTKEVAQYTDVSNIVKSTNNLSSLGDVKYVSDKAERGKYYKYINNGVPNKDMDTTNILTSEKLMTAFIYLYQPILFNDSLLEFTPSKGQDGEASVAATTISITNDQILNALDMHYNLTDDNYEQFSNNFGDVMSVPNISFDDIPTNVAINSWMVDNNSTKQELGNEDDLNIDQMIQDAFAAVGAGGIDTLTKDDINDFTADQDDLFSASLKTSLSASNIIGPNTTRVVYQTWGKYLSFISTDGLHSVGIQSQDDELISDYLNIKNKSEGWVDLASSSIDSKYSEWVSSNFDTITLIMWIINKKLIISSPFPDFMSTIKLLIFGKEISSSLQKSIDKKNEVKTFYTDNFEYYNLKDFTDKESNFLIGLMKQSNILTATWNILPTLSIVVNYDLNNEITKGGSYEE